VSSFKGGTLIAEDVRDLDAHQRRLCDPDGYRPDRCPRCDHDVLHVHSYPERHPRGEPGMPLVVQIAQYMCAAAACGATWRILPRFLALQRRLGTDPPRGAFVIPCAAAVVVAAALS
jgi:hypothetical protein